MNAKRNARNILVFGAIAIVLGTAFLPIGNSNLLHTKAIGKRSPMKSDISLEFEEEKEEVTLRFYNPTGMETITRKISKKEMEELDSVLQNGDSEEIALQLKNLHLLPKTMNRKEAEKLIAGRYYSPFLGTADPISQRGKRNWLCFLHMEGNWEQMNPFIAQLWFILQKNKENFPFLFSLLNPLIEFYYWSENNVPVKLANLLIGCLGKGTVTTVGLNGIWSYTHHGWSPASTLIAGFTGIWIQWESNDWVNGFATYVYAG